MRSQSESRPHQSPTPVVLNKRSPHLQFQTPESTGHWGLFCFHLFCFGRFVAPCLDLGWPELLKSLYYILLPIYHLTVKIGFIMECCSQILLRVWHDRQSLCCTAFLKSKISEHQDTPGPRVQNKQLQIHHCVHGPKRHVVQSQSQDRTWSRRRSQTSEQQ